MIPYGLTPANDQRAAQIFGIALKTWQDKQRWKDIPGLRILSREDAARRLYAEEQLQVARTNADLEADGKPALPLPPIPAAGHDLDLLDLEEARLSLPEKRQIKPASWKAYRYGDKTKLPEPDHTEAGVDLWYRKTIADWDTDRPQHRGTPKGHGGRPVGSKASYRWQHGADTAAGRKRARVAELLADHGSELTPAQVQEDLGTSLRHAERLLQDAREQAAERLLSERGELDPEEARRKVGLFPRSEANERVSRIRALLDEQGTTLTGPAVAAHLGIGMRQADEALRQVRLDTIRERRAEQGRVTARWIADTFGVKPDVAERLLTDSRSGTRSGTRSAAGS